MKVCPPCDTVKAVQACRSSTGDSKAKMMIVVRTIVECTSASLVTLIG